MIKVYNTAAVVAERQERINAHPAKSVLAFRGDMKANMACTDHRQLAERFNVAENTEEMESLRYRIINECRSYQDANAVLKNAAGSPLAATIEAFFGRFYLDMTRRAMEAPDLTSLIAREVVNYDSSSLIYLRDLMKYRGVMKTISGENDPVPFIEQNTGNTDTLALEIKALGWKDSLANRLWNSFFSMSKVVEAATDAYTDYRNSVLIGAIVAASFVASQKQAADATGSTLDEKTYLTFRAAKKLLKGLKDIQTSRQIATPEIDILCNSQDTDQIERVVRGQLEANGGGATGRVAPALGFGKIIEYDQGINHGITINGKAQSYPGVTAGKCYLFVPQVAMVATKRPLTMESGMGSVLELSTEERAWYCVQGAYTKALLGSSYAGTGLGAGYGAIVEVTLPT